MCTRYSLTVNKEQVAAQFGLSLDFALKASYNISACDQAYVITNEQPRKLEAMIWGLIPQTSKDGANNGKLINARIEGINSSSSFRIPIRKKRCLVLADSYYDWKKEGLKRWPFRIVNADQSLMVIAGVWEEREKGGNTIRSFSIITKPAVAAAAKVSHRMPLILKSSALQDLWLDEVNLDDVFQIVKEAEVGELKCYPISPKVDIIGYSSKELHEELAS
ncbi:MAG: putative SOS response-associated peptidase YedK [Polaribacter sp.]|jgi:putative SOS response-associated peptidase YedK